MIALLPAHDEADILNRTLSNLRAAQPPPDAILVIADHCTDTTASIAEQHGAVVFQRNEGEGGKGAALRWLFEQWPPVLSACPIIVVLDADSIVHPSFFAEVRRAFADGALAAQAFVQPFSREESVAPTLAAYSEMLSQVIDDALRARLGWPVPLRGTGMAFRAELLRGVLPGVQTETEDIELSILLAEREIPLKFLRDAIVYDPKPANAALLARQRARWLGGQFQVWRRHPWRIARLVLRGPAMWWLLSALLLKPKTLFVSLKVIASILAVTLPIPIWAKVIFWSLVAAELGYYVGGLWFVSPAERRRYARALIHAPRYLLIWGQSVWIAIRARRGWLSTRHK